MNIQNLIPVDYSNQRVLTYEQVAEGLNCSVDQLRSLYRSHKDEFQEGIHFFNVEGDDLRNLKKEMRNRHADSHFTCPSPFSFGKGAKCLKLWTCQGVARLSKPAADLERERLLVELVGAMEPSPDKNLLAREVANILLGRKFFLTERRIAMSLMGTGIKYWRCYYLGAQDCENCEEYNRCPNPLQTVIKYGAVPDDCPQKDRGQKNCASCPRMFLGCSFWSGTP